MLLKISTTIQPATELGYLLHKHPQRCQSFELSFGQAHVFYPEANQERCTAAMVLDVDPIGLVRRWGPAGNAFLLQQYVNDRPYVASSFMSVAIARVLGSALAGRCESRPELAAASIPFEAKLAVVPCRGGERLLRQLFEPLGYTVECTRHVLDEKFADWGESPYYTVDIAGCCRLQDLLSHLYVLIPVLDDEKHYWVTADEVQKLLQKGEGWLESHPEKELIVKRYLKHQGSLTNAALAKLMEGDGSALGESTQTEDAQGNESLRLNDQRLAAVVSVIRESGAKSVIDLGCGEGRLLRLLLNEKVIDRIAGMDVSHRALQIAESRLSLDQLPPSQRKRINLFQGSLLYRDQRLSGFDAASVVEVIEHLDAPRLEAFERAVFECARPRTVVITTPNADHNVLFRSLPAGRFRHKDHRFEWTRSEFQSWADSIARRFKQSVRIDSIGPEDQQLGSPTQMAVFSRLE